MPREDLKNIATIDDLHASLAKVKHDLVRWIVGGAIANGLITTLLEFCA